MANPYLVIGGIAVGIATAGFGILQVPGWIDSAKDASAQNDISQVAIAQAAALSVKGEAMPSVAAINGDDAIGVKVTTEADAANVVIVVGADGKSNGVAVLSDSGTAFARTNGGAVTEHASLDAAVTAVTTAVNAASE